MIAIRVLFDFVLGSVQGEMRRMVGEVEKPRPVRRFSRQIKEVEGVIRDRIRGVKLPFRIVTRLSPLRKPDQVVGVEKPLCADKCSIKLLKSVFSRIIRA